MGSPVSRTENLALYSGCYVKCIYQLLKLGEGDAAHRLWKANFLSDNGMRVWATGTFEGCQS
jgi:hypothetical protein